MKKFIPWVFSLAFLIAALYFFILLINAGISMDGAQSRADRLQERSKTSLYMLKKKWVGEPRSAVLTASKKLEIEGEIVKDYPEVIEVGDIIFDVKDGKVSDVRYMD